MSNLPSRFISVDPKSANIAASTTDPQQLNLYAYARNNPVLYVDPTGLDVELAESIDEVDVDLTAKAVGDALGATWVGNAIKAPPRVNDVASFSGGFGDAIIDLLAKFAGVQDFGLGYGRMVRMAFGINNVDTSSPDYAGGGALSTMLQFAVGAGEIKAAFSGAEMAVGATKNFGPRAFEKTVEVSPRAFANTERIAPTLRSGPAVTPVSTGGGAAGILADEAAQGAALAARRAAVAASNRQVAQYLEILEPIQTANLHLVKSGVHPGVVLNMSFQQANAVWVSKFGTPAPNFLK